jgi:hypothetical protein
MDFSFGPPPKVREAFSGFLNQATASWSDWLEWAGDTALLASANRVATAKNILSYSFTLRPGVSKLAAALAVPSGLAVESPGVLHLVVDFAWYKGLSPFAFDYIKQQYALLRAWLDTVDAGALEVALGKGAFDLLTGNGTIGQINAVVLVPPMWLTDP